MISTIFGVAAKSDAIVETLILVFLPNVDSNDLQC